MFHRRSFTNVSRETFYQNTSIMLYINYYLF